MSTDLMILAELRTLRGMVSALEDRLARIQDNEEETERLRESERARESWLSEAKDQLGYHDNVSFDRVWAETCELADSARALFGAIRPFAEVATGPLDVQPNFDNGGWVWGGKEQGQAITCWFGPTDFGEAIEAYSEHQRRVLHHLPREGSET